MIFNKSSFSLFLFISLFTHCTGHDIFVLERNVDKSEIFLDVYVILVMVIFFLMVRFILILFQACS